MVIIVSVSLTIMPRPCLMFQTGLFRTVIRLDRPLIMCALQYKKNPDIFNTLIVLRVDFKVFIMAVTLTFMLMIPLHR